jgi:uncharacterized protein YdiU (UPF0061 family)
MSNAMEKLSQKLSQKWITELPGNTNASRKPQQTPNMLWHHCPPTPVTQPRLIGYFEDVAQAIGLTHNDMQSDFIRDWLAGNADLPGAIPYASCYGGHQFGHWAGQLGDGRAITIAEIVHHDQRWELQLKGAGPTPYSRGGDGRAVLRSSIREFLCSEAMHHLGIPTTRALSLVLTGDSVIRDILYDGHPAPEPGAIVCRVAPSFIRFGHFEILAARDELDLLNRLIDFTIERDFAQLTGSRAQKIAAWFSQICTDTARLMVNWQRVGFVHGVMNTDNMSILGLTIDYGPYGWLDNYDPHWTPNTTDAQGRRYCFGNQPAIARWNLICLANALASVIDDHELLTLGIQLYDSTLNRSMLDMQCSKFGLENTSDLASSNAELINRAYEIMQQAEMDFTLFFIRLSRCNHAKAKAEWFDDVFYDPEKKQQAMGKLQTWLIDYQAQLNRQTLSNEHRIEIMARTNPKFVLRNYLTQQAIEKAEVGDYSELYKLMQLIKNSYVVTDENNGYISKRPEWAKHKVGCSMLSCSS